MNKAKVTQVRARILAEAHRHGHVSHRSARRISGLDQVWYHLDALCKQGLLQHDGYGRWIVPPTPRAKPDQFKPLIDDLCNLSNTIAKQATRLHGLGGSSQAAALRWVRQELDNLIYSADPSTAGPSP